MAVLAVSAVPAAPAAPAPQATAAASPAVRLGTVSFGISCVPAVQPDFDRGVSLLHSFWYDAALATFRKVQVADPGCAMAYWGEAMTGFPQVNGWPDTAAVAAALHELDAAERAPERTAREAAWIHALRVFYEGFTPDDRFEHAARYAQALGTLTAQYPDDLEAKVFYALALLAADPREDTTLVNPRKAYAILEPLFKLYPDHPGIAHYIIHACDNPRMASLALAAARRYADIAPAAPHALHMPGHIFARLGLWPDDIRSNLASRAAAESHAGMHMGAEARLHAMEFLEYAYLQSGEDDEARAIIAAGQTVRATEVDPRYPTYYGVVQARYPALYALETHDWVMATKLAPVPGGDAQSEGLTLLAHAVAAAHRHDRAASAAALHSLEALTASLPPGSVGALGYSLPGEIRAWAAFARGDLDGAAALLRPIAARQDQVGKGEVELPAREMLAEMLLLGGRAADALHAYQASLASDPNRFNGLLGAGEAAERAGMRGLAAGYYRTLLGNCPHPSGPARDLLAHAAAVAGAARGPSTPAH